jgi:UDP:flavonoid glycosyltransferase YjiC (YdhE family)
VRVLFASTRGAGHFNPLVPFVEGCLRGGHEVLVAGPPALAEPVARMGYPWWPGEAPPEDDLGAVWARVPTASWEEAERLVVAEIFGRLNASAMLPSLRAGCEEWRPDVILRETAEFASAIAAEELDVPHARVAVSLAAGEEQALGIAGPVLEERRPGLVESIRASPYLSLFPASLEDPTAGEPPVTYRFRDPVERAAAAPLADWWAGAGDPLVYVSFGSVTGSIPIAPMVFGAVLEAVAELPARVLLTIGDEADADGLLPAPANVRLERWVPQAEVFGHASAVVCHGGSGTTLGALAAGLPLVVVPLFADQPENARRVAEVGAGIAVEQDDGTPRQPMRTAIDPSALRTAIEAVLVNPEYGHAARRVAEEMRALPPTDAALAALAETDTASGPFLGPAQG